MEALRSTYFKQTPVSLFSYSHSQIWGSFNNTAFIYLLLIITDILSLEVWHKQNVHSVLNFKVAKLLNDPPVLQTNVSVSDIQAHQWYTLLTEKGIAKQLHCFPLCKL
jgi:hypothetical protein